MTRAERDGDRLRRRRAALGLSQARVARLTGIDRANISRVENGSELRNAGEASRLSEAYDRLERGEEVAPYVKTPEQILDRLEELAELIARGFEGLGVRLERIDARLPSEGARTRTGRVRGSPE
jgi:transcriptional regulator with XRE-family HTH domain